MSSDKRVVIFVPGITGSQLLSASSLHTKIWPNKVVEHKGDQAEALKLVSDDKLVTGEPIDEVIIKKYPVYDILIKYFKDNDYQYTCDEQELHHSTHDKILFGLGYDWRKDNADSAKRLADLVNNAWGWHQDAEFTLLAHSMGGLICRYALEQNLIQVSLNRLITLGTPHLGAPKALETIVGLENDNEVFHSDTLQTFSNTPGYPTTFQLLPGQNSFVLDDSSKEWLDVWNDPFKNVLISEMGVKINNFAPARAFIDGINNTNPNPKIPYHIIAGTDVKDADYQTITSFTYTKSQPLTPNTTTKGDGTVPEWSATFGHCVRKKNMRSKSFGGIKHMELVQDEGVLNYVYQVIASSDDEAG